MATLTTKEGIKAEILAVFEAKGCPLKYDYMLSEAVNNSFRDAIEKKINECNTLDFRKLDGVRKTAENSSTLEASLDTVREHFQSLTPEMRIKEALQCLKPHGSSLYELEHSGKMTKEERAEFEKAHPHINYVFYLSEKRLSFQFNITDWGGGRKYNSNAREHKAHLKALFAHLFTRPMPDFISELFGNEVIGADAFTTYESGGVKARLYKSGRFDLEISGAHDSIMLANRIIEETHKNEYSIAEWKD